MWVLGPADHTETIYGLKNHDSLLGQVPRCLCSSRAQVRRNRSDYVCFGWHIKGSCHQVDSPANILRVRDLRLPELRVTVINGLNPLRIPRTPRMGGVKCVNIEIVDADVWVHIVHCCTLAQRGSEYSALIERRPVLVVREECLAIIAREIK